MNAGDAVNLICLAMSTMIQKAAIEERERCARIVQAMREGDEMNTWNTKVAEGLAAVRSGI